MISQVDSGKLGKGINGYGERVWDVVVLAHTTQMMLLRLWHVSIKSTFHYISNECQNYITFFLGYQKPMAQGLSYRFGSIKFSTKILGLKWTKHIFDTWNVWTKPSLSKWEKVLNSVIRKK